MRNAFVFAGLAAVAAIIAPAARAADVVDTAAADPQFSTLVTAIKAAGLVDTLKNAKNITVFAPNNAAFGKLPKGTVESLLKPENKAKLIAILTYHVVGKKLMAADVTAMSAAADVATLDKGATIHVTPNPISINGAHVIKADIAADNGVIHVIDTVLIPGKAAKGHKMGKHKPAMGAAAPAPGAM